MVEYPSIMPPFYKMLMGLCIRCLYNALNDRLRSLLLSYDYSKSTDPLQPLASHLISLLTRDHPQTADIAVMSSEETFHLHKFVLSSRSPYFLKKLQQAPETKTWKLPSSIPSQAFTIAIKWLYLGELPRDVGGGPGTGFSDADILAGTDRISKHLEIQSLSSLILDSGDRRLARQRRADEVARGREQIDEWFQTNVLRYKLEVESSKANDIKWEKDNGVFADVLLRTDEEVMEDEGYSEDSDAQEQRSASTTHMLGIPLSSADSSRMPSRSRPPKKSHVYPCHKAMLIRSEFFSLMFSSSFKEASDAPHLHIVPIDCSKEVLEIILTFLYTEKADFGLNVAIDVLFAADMLLIEKLKAKAAVVISTLGNGIATSLPGENASDVENLDIYEILRAGWLTRVQRLEEFAARYIAYRLENYIDDPEFAELVKESANRISARQETDSIELLDDIRYYLSERFRLRFEDTGLEEITDETMVNREEALPDPQNEFKESAPLPHWGSGATATTTEVDEAVDMTSPPKSQLERDDGDGDGVSPDALQAGGGIIRTLDGEVAGDEFERDAFNYNLLLGKIDALLERLKLDA